MLLRSTIGLLLLAATISGRGGLAAPAQAESPDRRSLQQETSAFTGNVVPGGFSFVVATGTTVDALAASLATAGVGAAFFADSSGGFVSLVPSAPSFVNVSFVALFPTGVPAGTILIARGSLPPPPAAGPPPTGPIGAENANPRLAPSLAQVQNYIAWALDTNEALLPRNQRWSSQINEKIEMLSDPSLAERIISDRLFELGSVTSIDGSTITIVGTFPLSEQRLPVIESVNYLTNAIPIVEAFMATPYPRSQIYLWNGFIIGNSGGSGSINMEDRATYIGRLEISPAGPYDPALAHELSHAFIGNETLTQFLELYTHNMITTGSSVVSDWEWTRGYVAGDESNRHIHALLDIYELLGAENMSQAYQTVYSFRPSYGDPLCSACEQAFVDQAGAQYRDQVTDLIARVDPGVSVLDPPPPAPALLAAPITVTCNSASLTLIGITPYLSQQPDSRDVGITLSYDLGTEATDQEFHIFTGNWRRGGIQLATVFDFFGTPASERSGTVTVWGNWGGDLLSSADLIMVAWNYRPSGGVSMRITSSGVSGGCHGE